MSTQDYLYIDILAQSLEKKRQILASLYELTKQQEKVLADKQVDMDAFEAAYEEKQRLLEEMAALDRGFELIYEKVKSAIAQNKQQYVQHITMLQALIKQVTELGVQIRLSEQINRQKLEAYFIMQRKELQAKQMINKNVNNYYRQMSRITDGTSYFMDKKQ